jgi:hypothetical protein
MTLNGNVPMARLVSTEETGEALQDHPPFLKSTNR